MALFRNTPGSTSGSPATSKEQRAEGKLSEAMVNVNAYHRELTAEEIARGEHRHLVGGKWDEIGRLQLDGLIGRGLKPHHKLCDAGCGSLRAGVHFVNYLDAGNYYGLDINASLIDAGREELERGGPSGKEANLLVTDAFEMSGFGATFDYIIAFSLFTHLHANYIVRCLVEARKTIAPDGQLLATIFFAPRPAHLEPIQHKAGGVTSYYDKDPFHYSMEEIGFLGKLAGFRTELLPPGERGGQQRGVVFWPA